MCKKKKTFYVNVLITTVPMISPMRLLSLGPIWEIRPPWIWGSHGSGCEVNSLVGLAMCSSGAVQDFRATYSGSKSMPCKKPEEASGQLSWADVWPATYSCWFRAWLTLWPWTWRQIHSSEISGSPWTTLSSYCHLLEVKELFTKSKDPNSNSGQISLNMTVTVSLTYI